MKHVRHTVSTLSRTYQKKVDGMNKRRHAAVLVRRGSPDHIPWGEQRGAGDAFIFSTRGAVGSRCLVDAVVRLELAGLACSLPSQS